MNTQSLDNQTIDLQQAPNVHNHAAAVAPKYTVQDLENRASLTSPANSPPDAHNHADVNAAAQDHCSQDHDIYVNSQRDDASSHAVSLHR
ncbi:hypothetical protein HHI36_012929 [Cryptolaemus montrouzieri]|uniref:Uncharacterized protein n=1 Tax=Cryptolaemus montrouzieri TaxID=559131 RepID=A0ABD2NGS3_9CUCU